MDRKALVFSLRLVAVSLVLAAVALVFNTVLKSCSSEVVMPVVPEKKPPMVIIDAGHGGADGGAIASGLAEKELNLAVALELGYLLKENGFTVIMTREGDIMPDSGDGGTRKQRELKARLKIANDNPDAVLVSIHMNKFPLASCSGMQVFYSPNNPDSELLAESVRRTAVSYLQPENNRENKRADSGIYLLWKARQPAITVECGFISNPEEAALLSQPEYRRSLACAIYCGLTVYFSAVSGGN